LPRIARSAQSPRHWGVVDGKDTETVIGALIKQAKKLKPQLAVALPLQTEPFAQV